LRTSAAVVLSFAVGIAAGIIGQRFFTPPPGGGRPLYAASCESHVKLSIKYDAQNKPHIDVDPPLPVCLALGRSLIWDVAGSTGKVTIVFDDQEDENQQKKKGPFHRVQGNTFNTGVGVYERDIDAPGVGAGPVDSNPAKHIALDRPWKYTVKWRLPGQGQQQPDDSDPAVCVRD
jgi:hypothetical protein